MPEKNLNGYSEVTKKVLEESGLKLEFLKTLKTEKAFLELKKTATDQETVHFFEEVFGLRLKFVELINLIQHSKASF